MRYDSVRFPDRTLAVLVQSACNKPESRLITHNHVRSAHGAWMAGPCRIPKLTVRVRFPSPAPHAKSVAIHTNWAPSPIWIGIRRHQNSALVPLRVPLAMRDRLSAHRCECPDTLGTAWLKGVNMTEKLLDVSPTSRAFTSARCRHRGQVDVGGDHDRLDVASRLLLSVSAEMTNTGRRLAGRDPEGAPRSAQ
jgi:hypothetical protein